MGWLNRDRNGPEGFYTGDAPVSAPGWGNTEPTPYGSNRPAPPTYPGSVNVGASTQASPPGWTTPPDLAAGAGSFAPTTAPGMPRHQPSQPGPHLRPGQPRRGGAAWGGLFALLMVLTIAGAAVYFVVGPGAEESADTSSSAQARPTSPSTGEATKPTDKVPPTGSLTPAEVPLTPMKESGVAQFGGNSYRIKVLSAQWQPAVRWNASGSSKVGHLVVRMTIVRTDELPDVRQISWADWGFVAGKKEAVRGELIGAGYSDQLTTLRLEPAGKATGTISFEIDAVKGELQLGSGDDVTGRWDISAVAHKAPKATLGKIAKTTVAQLPFSVTITNPIWTKTGSPNLETDPKNGYLLVLDARYISTLKPDPASSTPVYVSPLNWQYKSKTGKQQLGTWGQVGRELVDEVQILPGETVEGKIMLDVPGQAGTLALIGRDGVPVITWAIPAP